MVIVDTAIWINAFRSASSPERRNLDRLLSSREVLMVGPVLAEVIQGARGQREFDWLSQRLSELPYVEETRDTWARVGSLSYQLRQRGITISLVDLLIATLALDGDHQVYSLDGHFRQVPGLKLYEAGPF
jgi:hypothetical protein